MNKFRDREVYLISKFYELNHIEKNNDNYIPSVIIGTEIGSGYELVYKKLRLNTSLFKYTIYYSFSSYSMDSYNLIAEILDKIFKKYSQKNELYDKLFYWFIEYNKNGSSVYSDSILISYTEAFLFEFSKESSVLLIFDNLHFISSIGLNLLKTIFDKINICRDNQVEVNLHLLAFYRLEQFVLSQFRELISRSNENGLVLKITNFTRSEFFKMIDNFIGDLTFQVKNKLWNISLGSVVVFIELINYLLASKEFDGTTIQSILSAKDIMDKLPINRDEFYERWLSDLSDAEYRVLQTFAFVDVPINLEFSSELLNYPLSSVKHYIKKMILKRFIKRDSLKKDTYSINSVFLKFFLVEHKNNNEKRELYSYILEKFEIFYNSEIIKNLFLLKNFSTLSRNKDKIKFYLFLILRLFPRSQNNRKIIQTFAELISVENNNNIRADYILEYAKILITMEKFRSAEDLIVEILHKEIDPIKQVKLNLLLFDIFMKTNMDDKVENIDNRLRILFKDKTIRKENLVTKNYYYGRLKYYIHTGRYYDALFEFRNFKILWDEVDYKLSFLKSKILLSLGFVNNSIEILKSLSPRIEKLRDFRFLVEINMQLGEGYSYKGNFKTAEKYFNLALITILKHNLKRQYIQLLISLASLWLKADNEQKFLKNIYQAINAEYRIKNDDLLSAEIFGLFMEYYMRKNKYNEAVSCAKSSLKCYLGDRNHFVKMKCLLNLAECYYYFENSNEGNKIFLKVENTISEYLKINYSGYISLVKAKAMFYIENYDKSLLYLNTIDVDKNRNRHILVDKFILEAQINRKLGNRISNLEEVCDRNVDLSDFKQYILFEINRTH